MSKPWPQFRLSDLTTKVGSGATPKGGSESYQTSGTPLIRSMNVVFFGFKRRGLVYLNEQQAAQLAGVTVNANDVLLNITGASIGRVSIAPPDMAGARVNQHVCIVRPNAAVDPRFLAAYLSAPAIQDQIANDNFGVTRQALTKQQILDLDVPVPPRAEQTRIADQLDTLLARVNACNDHLDAIPGILKRFRQAVLRAAMNGTSNEWRSSTIGEIAADLRYGTSKKCDYRDDGTGVLRIPNITPAGSINARDLKRADFDESETKKLALQIGDLLVIRSNGSLDLVGKCGLVTEEQAGLLFAGYLMRLRMNAALVRPKFVHYWLMAPAQRGKIELLAKSTSGVNNLNAEELKSLTLLFPPLDGQDEVIGQIDHLLAVADRIESRCAAIRTHAHRLTPQVLAKAFRGELVEQDPQDEPASALIARVTGKRAETLNSPALQQRRGRSPGALKKAVAMTKSRQDDDVMSQPYLANHLRRLGKPVTAEALFRVAELSVADFYKQLAWEVVQGYVKDNQITLEPAHAAR